MIYINVNEDSQILPIEKKTEMEIHEINAILSASFINIVYLTRELAMIVDDEFLYVQKGFNKLATDLYSIKSEETSLIYGNVIICKIKYTEEGPECTGFDDLSEFFIKLIDFIN